MIPVTITMDATRALARFSEAGIPAAVRTNLRRILPDLTKQLGARVDEKLDAGLRTRRRLQTKTELVENPTTIAGRVSVAATAEPRLLPRWLESGTRAHPIVATNAPALVFFWERLGRVVAFKSVWHPGYPGLFYMRDAFQDMEAQILGGIEGAVRAGVRGEAA